MKKDSKRSPYRTLVKWTIVMAIALAVCTALVTGINVYSQTALAKQIEQVEAQNKELETQFNLAKADYENATRTGQSKAWPPAAQEGMCIVDLSTYPLENTTDYLVERQALLEGGMMLVNHWHPLPEDVSEENIKSVRSWTNSRVRVRDDSIRLYQPAAEAIDALLMDAGLQELKFYIVQDAYRKMEDQQKLYDNVVADIQKRNPNMSMELVKQQAIKTVNYPGTSEYQTGFSFQMKLYNKDDAKVTGTPFQSSEQGKYFTENAWKYGLIFRFPTANHPTPETQDKSYKTGNSGTLNIYRYVGLAHSTAMKILNMCLEEYIEYLIATPHFAIYDNGTLLYEVFRQPYAGGNCVVQVPRASVSYVSSIDNMGGVVTAFYYQ